MAKGRNDRQREEQRTAKAARREASERRQQRNKLLVRAAIVLVALGAAALGYRFFQQRHLLDTVTTASYPAGQHVAGRLTWKESPPVGGAHNLAWQNCGVYSEPIHNEHAVHSLEHGATIVWYDPSAPADRIDRLLAFYDRRLQDAQVGQDRVIVAPFDFPDDPDGLLPDGTQMALVAWHRLRTCAAVDLAVAFDFTSQYSFPTTAGRDYAGDAPEPGASIG